MFSSGSSLFSPMAVVSERNQLDKAFELEPVGLDPFGLPFFQSLYLSQIVSTVLLDLIDGILKCEVPVHWLLALKPVKSGAC